MSARQTSVAVRNSIRQTIAKVAGLGAPAIELQEDDYHQVDEVRDLLGGGATQEFLATSPMSSQLSPFQTPLSSKSDFSPTPTSNDRMEATLGLPSVPAPNDPDSKWRQFMVDMLRHSVISAATAVITFAMHTSGSTTTVGASSTVAIVAGVMLESPYRELVHGASFVGMTAAPTTDERGIIETTAIVIFGAILMAVMLKTVHKYFVGFGGRLGAAAFVCSFVASGVLNMSVTISQFPPEFYRWEFWVITPLVGILSSLATYQIQLHRNSNASLASAVVSIACVGLFSSNYFLNWPGTKDLQEFALAGTFAGMTNNKKRFTVGWLQYAIAGFFSSFCLCALLPFAPGVGGKFGFSAIFSTIAVFYCTQFLINWKLISAPEESAIVKK